MGYEKLFTKRPLGFQIVMSRKKTIMGRITDPDLKGIQVGSRIISVNSQRVEKSGYNACMKLLQHAALPLTIRFKSRPKKSSQVGRGNDGRSAEYVLNEGGRGGGRGSQIPI